MSTESRNGQRSRAREIVYWVIILAVMAAAAIFLLTSRRSHQKATRVESTATAGRTQSATATAEARSQAATATVEARTPEAGD